MSVRGYPFVERRSVAGEPLHWIDEWRDLAAYGALLYQLVHRDLTIRYRRSVLGFLWTMLHPLLLMLIFLVVFSALFRSRAPHYETYFLSAYIAWTFFSQTTLNAMASVEWNGLLMKRVRVPLSIFTLAIVVAGLVNLGLSLLVLFAIMLIAGAPLDPSLAFLPVSVLILAVFTFGVSLALTALSTFLADVQEMVKAVMPALLYLTPVVYPLSIVPDRYRWMIRLNPLAHLVELVRAPIHSGTIPPLGPATLLALGALVFGWLIFSRLAPHFHARL